MSELKAMNLSHNQIVCLYISQNKVKLCPKIKKNTYNHNKFIRSSQQINNTCIFFFFFQNMYVIAHIIIKYFFVL